MAQSPSEIKTTTGDRLSIAAVNAGLGAASAAGGYAAYVGIAKLLKTKSSEALKYATPTTWKFTAAWAAIVGAYSFATADRGKELAREKAMADYLDPTKGSEKERSSAFDKQWDAIDKGDLSNLKESTKFRDKVNASRVEGKLAR